MLKGILSGIILSLVTLSFTPGIAADQKANGAAPAVAQQASKITWLTNYSQAVSEAQKEKKPILLFFTGSDWCGWCKKLDQEVFQTPAFAQAAGNSFVFVEVDFPMNQQLPANLAQQNASLKQKYGVTGYPTVVLLDSNENFVAETGYRPGGGAAYAEYLKQLVK